MPLYDIATNGNLEPFIRDEWLLTNGTGAYSSSSVVGCNTRRYHGLLCAATQPPVGRVMTLNRIGEVLHLDGKPETHELSVNQFGDQFHPTGHRYLKRFQLDESARWDYMVDGVRIIKEVQLVRHGNTVGIRYTIEPDRRRSIELSLLPFVSLRDFHSLRRAMNISFYTQGHSRGVLVRLGNIALHMEADKGKFVQHQDWWYGHTYAVEQERGLDHLEDLFTPGRFVFETTHAAAITIWAGLDRSSRISWEHELATSATHTAQLAKTVRDVPPPGTVLTPTLQRLIKSSDDFIVARPDPAGGMGTTILAGYPWFADWGRDTMISLPGLLLSTRRFAEARQVLSLFARYVSQGMIPNRFDDYTNEPSYNTVDASLWFIHAVHEYLKASGDEETCQSLLLPACRQIIDGYRHGTRYRIMMDPADGLITQGDATTQLTWMDAKCDGIAFTPRQGKAVEINALWYHALVLSGENDLAARVAESFRNAFWLNAFRGLADVVRDDGKDTAIRPNQIFAVSLPNSPLLPDQRIAVVEVVRRELLTPMGLRTLSRADVGYRSHYAGTQRQRDSAYHNGIVWPWLLGGFLDAYLRAHGDNDQTREQARKWLWPLVEHMTSACVGSISEIFEAEPPHRPVGACAQAWSVAEVLRLAMRLGM